MTSMGPTSGSNLCLKDVLLVLVIKLLNIPHLLVVQLMEWQTFHFAGALVKAAAGWCFSSKRLSAKPK